MGLLAWVVIVGWIAAFGGIYLYLGSTGWLVYYGLLTVTALSLAVSGDSSVAVGMVLGWMFLPIGVGAAGGVFS